MSSIYKRIWTHLGKRPYTYIYRDIWHKYEYFPQLQWLITGIILATFSGTWQNMAILWLVYTFGYINGHFFWGKRYIPNQQGED